MFSWTQNRVLLPAWFGCGTAFESVGRRDLRDLYERLPFFRAVVDNLEMTLAKSSLSIARGYLSLVRDPSLFAVIEEEKARTVAGVLAATGVERLLERQTDAARSVELRNPYVDPMNAVQVELLRRHRAGDETAQLPLLRSIAGHRRGAAQHGLMSGENGSFGSVGVLDSASTTSDPNVVSNGWV